MLKYVDSYKDEQARTNSELAQIHFQHDRIYTHHTLKLHYTTYDARRDEDSINPRTPNRFILVPSHNRDSHILADRFWYARVLGIYHANVSYRGSRPKRMDFLWVRWLARMTDVPGGWDTTRLDQVGYFSDSEHNHAFEFVDPADVIRAVHLIPRFAGNQTVEYLGGADSVAADNRLVGDWKHYYVGRFSDRDLLMRFTGMAIGHTVNINIPPITANVPEEALSAGYEYTDEDDQVPSDLGPEGDGENDAGEDSEAEEDREGDDESDGDQMSNAESDESADDVDYGVSW